MVAYGSCVTSIVGPHAMRNYNDGAPGVDGVTFEAIEKQGVDGFLEQIRDELNQRNYAPLAPVTKGHGGNRREPLERPVMMVCAVLPFDRLGHACV